MKIWGIHKKYPALSWWENFTGGHLSIGPVTIYGANAMNWAVNIRTKRLGYICFTLPTISRFRKNKIGQWRCYWYFYLSPNATPWASTFYIGTDKAETSRAKIRKQHFGHGFDSVKNKDKLGALNQKIDNILNGDF